MAKTVQKSTQNNYGVDLRVKYAAEQNKQAREGPQPVRPVFHPYFTPGALPAAARDTTRISGSISIYFRGRLSYGSCLNRRK